MLYLNYKVRKKFAFVGELTHIKGSYKIDNNSYKNIKGASL